MILHPDVPVFEQVHLGSKTDRNAAWESLDCQLE